VKDFNFLYKKTKIMTINATPEPITINNDPLEEVEDFTYLGSVLSKDNGAGKDTKARLSKARVAFAKLQTVCHVFYQMLLVFVSNQLLLGRGWVT
jgi:hypothetical protein